MLRVTLPRRASPSLRAMRCFASDASPTLASQQRQQRQRAADLSLHDKFNLASLNGGKNPFEVSSNRLLKKAPKTKQPKKDKAQLRDVYSLEYLTGKKTTTTTATAATPSKRISQNNPFDVTSAKLM